MEQTRQRTQQRPQNARPRRKKRRAPIRELAICAAVIFVAGFLMGFLIRGAFVPKEEKPAETTLPPVETTTEPKAQPPVPLDDWRLVLVNAANPLPEDYSVSMTQLSDGLQVDKRCYSDLQAMLNACTAAGLSPRLESAYRDWAQQNERFDQEMARLVADGKLPREKFDNSYNAWKNHISHGNCYRLGKDMDHKIKKLIEKGEG